MRSQESQKVRTVKTGANTTVSAHFAMPRKRKLLAHLARQNEKQARLARTAPSSSVINVVCGPERPDQSGSGDPESDSELPYWPAEEDAESISNS